MATEYYELEALTEVTETALEIPRAVALCRAIHRHRDTRLLTTLKAPESIAGSTVMEVLVLEMDCEQVPPKNPAGIQYCERLALFVTSNEKSIPEVIALRKDFPVIMHQNHGRTEGAASLCVYFGPAAAALRTWTPESFLHRIQWWLEASARDELHPADQPVEQLFFNSKYELVLPWNVDDLRKSGAHRAVIFRGKPRPDGSLTCFVEFVPKDAKVEAQTVAHVELTLPAIKHGVIERTPQTLGMLADVLQKRGLDLTTPLRKALEERIPTAGATAAEDDTFTVVLVHIPMARSEGEAPTSYQRKAFGIAGGSLALGEALGAYMLHAGRYYFNAASALGAETPTKWRDIPIEAMEVLQRNTAEKTRIQSGTDDEGPDGVLVGAGSLGSTMLNLWGRSGWGRWTVIDNDHIKPHNLSRHTALGQQVGDMKAEVAAELHSFVMQGASEVKAICADACDTTNPAVAAPLESSGVVVDASTTLEYPHLASTRDGLARHVSVFMTPDGNSSVMLAEDEKRELRVRTLEAQYYRAIINAEWGSRHLEGNLRHFWSGASCRDISVVMPYSKIATHAGTLAEQVRFATRQPDARIRVWQRDPESGAITVHRVDAHPEHRLQLGNCDLFIDEGVYEKLRAMRAASLPEETGGILLGYYDLTVKSVAVVDALPAPADSKSSREAFERGVGGLKDAVAEAARRTAGIVQYIGEWHSHPSGCSARPSTDDGIQLMYLALRMAEDGLPAVQLIVGDDQVLVLQAAVAA